MSPAPCSPSHCRLVHPSELANYEHIARVVNCVMSHADARPMFLMAVRIALPDLPLPVYSTDEIKIH